jgi:iron complex outermembrane receptor protein
VPLTDTLTGTVGARHATFSDHLEDSGTLPGGIEADDDVTVAELGLSYRLSPEWRLYARRDGNFRFPLVDENTVTQPSITALKTQTGISYEAGAEWTRGADRFKAVLYRLDLDNEIDYDPNATGPWGPFGANVNLDATRRRGMIVEARRQFTRQLAVSGDYTYTDPEITGGPYEGNDIPFVAENVLRLAAEWRATPQWRLFLEGVHIGERYQDADYQNTREKVPATDVLNGSASYERGRWSADLRVNNLTDKEYVTYAAYNNGVSGFYPAPRRNFVLTARYHF